MYWVMATDSCPEEGNQKVDFAQAVATILYIMALSLNTVRRTPVQ